MTVKRGDRGLIWRWEKRTEYSLCVSILDSSPYAHVSHLAPVVLLRALERWRLIRIACMLRWRGYQIWTCVKHLVTLVTLRSRGAKEQSVHAVVCAITRIRHHWYIVSDSPKKNLFSSFSRGGRKRKGWRQGALQQPPVIKAKRWLVEGIVIDVWNPFVV